MRTYTLFLSAAALSLAFAPAPFPRPLDAELKKMQGTWKATAWSMEVKEGGWRRRGQLRPCDVVYVKASAGDGTSIKIVQGCLSIRRGIGLVEEWHLCLDSRGHPGRLNIVQVRTGQTMLGIYKREGDTLTICYAEPGKDRPAAFSNKEQWLLVLQRTKP
jgi:hypothetical protein